ncbi:cytochrome c biogenesis protein CcdA [Leucobacter sp. CSA1]|uniref:Cytochrome c biogenesis protein CcdA n=1 Tax=Leucobacter chromiisoli TaxID=2796471 RepID=A0A934Q8L9_9MICO|nr:cytochrome c biogenesis protein CcdA [Leucobacter chromiisoli]MBK0419305.1 cytochrome c biogenesis protein CcdA [Leucobacter chromiisoli]
MSLSLLGAFLGGVLTLLSPCSAMLLPAFFAYAFNSAGALLARTGVFFLGLATALVPLGLLAGSLGVWVSAHRHALMTGAAILVIALGLVMLLGIRLPALARQRGAKSASIASVYALGTVYGLAGVCAGPLLGAALTLAAYGGAPLLGGLVMLSFAAGMAVPLLLLALLWNRIPAVRRLVRPRELVLGRWRNVWTNIVAGAATIGIGILLLATRGTSALGSLVGYSEQARLEGWVQQASAAIPNWVFVVAALFLGGLWVATRQAQRAGGPAG